MDLKAQADHASGLMAALTKFIGGLVLVITILGAAIAIGGEILARRIIIDAVDLDKSGKYAVMIPKDLNLRIVEKIEYIRAAVRSEQRLEQKAVTRVDDISFKAEGIDFSVVKLLASVKAAFGFSDTHVTGALGCYHFDCELEPEDEDVPGGVKDTLRLRLSLIMQGPGGTRTFQKRLSVNTKNFRKEIDTEMLAAAEAVMEQTDPVTAASFYYLLSKEPLSVYNREKNRGLAVTAAQFAYRQGRADLCWASGLLATIAVDQNDLVGADARINAVPLSTRAADATCDAQLSLAKGLVNRGMLTWHGGNLPPDEAARWLSEARRNFLLGAGRLGAAPETRSDALIEAARTAVRLSPMPETVTDSEALLAQAADCRSVSYLVGSRCDLAAKLLREAAQIERHAGRLDPALLHNWEAVKADPGNAQPYIELGDILLERAMSPGEKDVPSDDLREADALLHQALNGSDDAEKAGILTEIAEISIARGDLPEAMRNLANVGYALDRSLYQPRSIGKARRAFSLWLFVLRLDAARFCASGTAGLQSLKKDSASMFETASKAAACEGDISKTWPLTQTYESDCGALSAIPLAKCLRDRGRP